MQLSLQAVAAETPPASPVAGEIYALGPAPQGAWAGEAGRLAVFDGTAWSFLDPEAGWRAHDLGAGRALLFDGSDWQPELPELSDLDGVGIGAGWDGINRLSVAAQASLFSHAGSGGHQIKINKAAAPDTASLLFQSGWTGHAEMGLAGDTGFSVKISADGSAWHDALRMEPATGETTLAPDGTVRARLSGARLELDVPLEGTAVQASATDVTAGRVARADYVYGPGNLLGTVAQSGGVPTGAAIERGSTADGAYVRFADGTQICTHRQLINTAIATASGGVFTNGADITVTYAAGFAAGSLPAISLQVLRPASTDHDLGAILESCGPTSATYRLTRIQSDAGARDITCLITVTGRWF